MRCRLTRDRELLVSAGLGVMDLLIDETVDAPIVSYLRSVGHDVVAIAEAMPSLADTEVLQRALQSNRVLVTIDADFGNASSDTGVLALASCRSASKAPTHATCVPVLRLHGFRRSPTPEATSS